jgi:hypothetical protein
MDRAIAAAFLLMVVVAVVAGVAIVIQYLEYQNCLVTVYSAEGTGLGNGCPGSTN